MDSQHAKFDGPRRPRSFPGRARAELPCRGCDLGPIRLIGPGPSEVLSPSFRSCRVMVLLFFLKARVLLFKAVKAVPYAAQRASSYFVLLA